jgi:hypothetical protein
MITIVYLSIFVNLNPEQYRFEVMIHFSEWSLFKWILIKPVNA